MRLFAGAKVASRSGSGYPVPSTRVRPWAAPGAAAPQTQRCHSALLHAWRARAAAARRPSALPAKSNDVARPLAGRRDAGSAAAGARRARPSAACTKAAMQDVRVRASGGRQDRRARRRSPTASTPASANLSIRPSPRTGSASCRATWCCRTARVPVRCSCDEVVRLVMVLKAVGLGRGCSGVRPEVIEALLALVNARVYPCIPGQGLGRRLGRPGSARTPGGGVDRCGRSPGRWRAHARAGRTAPRRHRTPGARRPRKGWRCSTARRYRPHWG